MARKSSAVRVYFESVTTGLQRGIRRAESMVKSFNKKVSALTSKINGALSLVGLGLGANAVKNMILDLDKLAKSAKNLGVSGEYFQKLSFAADRSGVSLDSVFSAFTKLKKGAGDAATGNKEMIAHFARLGLTVDDLRKLSPEELFDTVVKRLNSMKDPLERDATAAALFGRSFSQLNVFLRDYKSIGDELEARGGIISNEQLEAAEKFDDMMTNIAQTVKGIAFNSGFVKSLADLLEGIDLLLNSAAEREVRASAGTEITREQAFELALNSGKLTPEEIEAFKSLVGEGWVKGYAGNSFFPNQKKYIETIENAMKRLGMGNLAGYFEKGYFGMLKYSNPVDVTMVPDWAGGKEKREARKKKIIDDANAEKEAQKKAKETQAKAKEEQEKYKQQKKDDAILELQKKSEREALRNRDPVAAAIADFIDKYGEIDQKQRAKLTAIFTKEFEKEKKKEKEKEKENPETGSVLGQFGADMIERSLGGTSRLAERTASATEQSAKLLAEIRDKKNKGATFS